MWWHSKTLTKRYIAFKVFSYHRCWKETHVSHIILKKSCICWHFYDDRSNDSPRRQVDITSSLGYQSLLSLFNLGLVNYTKIASILHCKNDCRVNWYLNCLKFINYSLIEFRVEYSETSIKRCQTADSRSSMNDNILRKKNWPFYQGQNALVWAIGRS